MNRDKQIEEMAKICHFYDDGICHLCEELLVSCDRKCDLAILVENLYTEGYRKASDVAREIFEDIDRILGMLMVDYANFNRFSEADTIRYAITYLLDELKKKHTQEE